MNFSTEFILLLKAGARIMHSRKCTHIIFQIDEKSLFFPTVYLRICLDQRRMKQEHRRFGKIFV